MGDGRNNFRIEEDPPKREPCGFNVVGSYEMGEGPHNLRVMAWCPNKEFAEVCLTAFRETYGW